MLWFMFTAHAWCACLLFITSFIMHKLQEIFIWFRFTFTFCFCLCSCVWLHAHMRGSTCFNFHCLCVSFVQIVHVWINGQMGFGWLEALRAPKGNSHALPSFLFTGSAKEVLHDMKIIKKADPYILKTAKPTVREFDQGSLGFCPECKLKMSLS